MEKSKVAVITGGSGVLCSEMARHLGAAGYKVAILGRSLEKGKAVAEQIESQGGTALAFSVDVLDKEALARTHQQINAVLGSCDLLINGAGGNHPGGTTANSFFEDDQNEASEQSFFNLDFDGVRHVFDKYVIK